MSAHDLGNLRSQSWSYGPIPLQDISVVLKTTGHPEGLHRFGMPTGHGSKGDCTAFSCKERVPPDESLSYLILGHRAGEWFSGLPPG